MADCMPDELAELVADLRELVDAARQDYRRREQAANTPMPILRAAGILAGEPGMEPSRLAGALRLERSTVSNLLRDMQERGLVRRRKLRSDRRFVTLELTERGHAMLRKAGNAGAGLVSRAASLLQPGEVLRLSLALRPLLAALRRAGASQGAAPARRQARLS